MTPIQARAARAMLNLPIAAICEATSVGKRTLTEFEAGVRNINDGTRSKIVAFYIAHGISFQNTEQSGEAVAFRTSGEEIELKADGTTTPIHEFADHFATDIINHELDLLRETLARLRPFSNFSREFLSLMLRRSNMNQKDLAETVGCSPAHISAIMIGKKTLSAALCNRMSDLNFTPDVHGEGVISAEREIDALLRALEMHIDQSAKALASIYAAGELSVEP
jgi:transcriptional regulator with XRE-family HTH domain